MSKTTNGGNSKLTMVDVAGIDARLAEAEIILSDINSKDANKVIFEAERLLKNEIMQISAGNYTIDEKGNRVDEKGNILSKGNRKVLEKELGE